MLKPGSTLNYDKFIPWYVTLLSLNLAKCCYLIQEYYKFHQEPWSGQHYIQTRIQIVGYITSQNVTPSKNTIIFSRWFPGEWTQITGYKLVAASYWLSYGVPMVSSSNVIFDCSSQSSSCFKDVVLHTRLCTWSGNPNTSKQKNLHMIWTNCALRHPSDDPRRVGGRCFGFHLYSCQTSPRFGRNRDNPPRRHSQRQHTSPTWSRRSIIDVTKIEETPHKLPDSMQN